MATVFIALYGIIGLLLMFVGAMVIIESGSLGSLSDIAFIALGLIYVITAVGLFMRIGWMWYVSIIAAIVCSIVSYLTTPSGDTSSVYGIVGLNMLLIICAFDKNTRTFLMGNV